MLRPFFVRTKFGSSKERAKNVRTKIGSEAKVATTDFNIRFLRPFNTDVRCVARVIKAGRTMSLSEAELYDSENNLVAVAQVNYIKLD